MKMIRTRFSVIFFLVIIFIAPSLVAYLFYTHPQWLPEASTNRGSFVSPRFKLDVFPQKNHWRLLYWSPSMCDEHCIRRLNMLARVRLALGRHLYQVDACVLTESQTISVKQTKLLQKEGICVLKLSGKNQVLRAPLGSSPLFFIVNPENDLVLKYSDDMKAEDLFHDIKHLLTESS